MKRFKFLLDAALLALLGLFSRFLMGPSLKFQFFSTGYQDWIYHAFRIERILSVGITSWDHIWSNGLNHWKSYQYIPHLLTAGLISITHDTVPHGMIVMTWLIILFSMFSSYVLLRKLKISPLASFMAVLIFWTSSSVWANTKDFSIFFFTPFIPFFLYFFSLDIIQKRVSLRTPALAGISWAIHPILGAICSGLFIFYILTKWIGKRGIYLLLPLTIFFLTSALFSLPFLLSGYHFSSNHLDEPGFVAMTINPDYMGFGLVAGIAIILSVIGNIIFVKNVPQWSKYIIFYVAVMFGIIQLMLAGAAPKIFYMFQLSRSIPMLTMLAIFPVAALVNAILRSKSRFVSFLAVAMIAAFLVQIVSISSTSLAPSVSKLNDPVSTYFKSHTQPSGEVWVADVSKASFFSPNIRFANSYNGHMEPSPVSSRLNDLMQNDLPFTGITKKQVDLISSYSRALGIEYIFLPKLSSLVDSITSSASGSLQPTYNLAKDSGMDGQFAVLQNSTLIAHAYTFQADPKLLAPAPALPTLSSESWVNWDQNISDLDAELRTQPHQSIEVGYPSEESLTLNVAKALPANQGVLLMESYDPEWKANLAGVKIQPTSTRFMYLTLPQGWTGKLTLTHSWPVWHWPLQIFSLTLAGCVLTLESVWFWIEKRRKLK